MGKIEEYLKNLKGKKADIAIFAGSGFENLIELEKKVSVSYKKIGFDFKEIKGHKRELVFGTKYGKKIVLASRFHLYEDGATDNLFDLFKVLSSLGVKTVISTTATGGIRKGFKEGDLMIIKDHINLSGTNPLIAIKPIEFVDLTNAYDDEYRKICLNIAKKNKIKLFEGVHLQTMGPTYETPAEVNYYRAIGADTVSMSMAFDCICSNYFKMRFLAFAGVSNKAVEEDGEALTHEEVVKTMRSITGKLNVIIDKFLQTV